RRCSLRDQHPHCLVTGGDTSFALSGGNRYHAVFTQGHPCVIVNPSTLAPALIALGARAEVLGPKGKRTVELSKFYQAPKSADEREHVLAPNELVLSMTLAGGAEQFFDVRNASYDVRHKQAYDWPLVQAAVALPTRDVKVKGARIVLGHVAPN